MAKQEKDMTLGQIMAQINFIKKLGAMSDDEFRIYLETKEKETKQFVVRVEEGLQGERSEITPERFDQIADEIEKLAPNIDALYQGTRALGRFYTSQRRR